MAAQENPLGSVVEEKEPVVEVTAQEGVTPRTRRFRPHSKNRVILLVVLALAVVAAGSWLWYYFGGYESTDDAQVDVHIAPVSARISGYVIRVNVDDNQYVEKGTVLVEIDPKDYQVLVDKARADLANAEATAQSLNINVPITSVNTISQLTSAASDVESSNAGIIAAEKQLAAARAQVDQAEANDVKAQDDLRRYKQLVDKQNVSEQIYDQALAAAKASTANVAAAHANVSAAEQSVQQAKAKLAQAQANHRYAQTGPQQVASTRARALSAVADVQQKRAVLEQAELNLKYTKVVAPVSGLVNKTVVEGMNVQPGQVLLNVVPLDEVWITANFKETQLRRMKEGQRVEFEVDSSGRRYKGHLDSIAGATGPLFSALPPENATGNYVKVVQRIPVKIILDPGQNSDRALRPGMSVVPKVYLR
jgi:membrane fusion protein (multidrug efflux system)